MKNYALVGCGGRGLAMFAQPLVQKFASNARLVGVCDVNQGRMDYLNKALKTQVPTYTSFGKMLKETRPDVVIVTSKDSTHYQYIIASLKAGLDVITEKPMVINEKQCRNVLELEKKTGRKVTVTFNYRFVPYVTKVKEMLAQNVIGKILSVDFNYQLDRSHGADYFRRWHRRKENSGGLLVHKSTHHFDLMNWWLGQDPVQVYAMGSLQFYGATRKERGERCMTCRHTRTCEYYRNINAPSTYLGNSRELFAKVEHLDGYFRDQCVFSDQIDIEDTMNLTIRYSKGTQMSYSLNAHCTYEGWRAALNGTEGRLEAEEWHSGPYRQEKSQEIRIIRWKKPVQTIKVPIVHGDHGGGDTRLHKMLFDGPRADPLGHMATSRAGAMSILTGVAGNISIKTNKPVDIADLLQSKPKRTLVSR